MLRRTRTRGATGVLLVGSSLVLIAATATPASARPVERGSFSESVPFLAEDFCDVPGLVVEGTRTVHGWYVLNSRGADGVVYGMQHIEIEVTDSNQATGESVRVLERTMERDLQVTDNGDGTLTILVMATGNLTVYGTDGKAIARDPGQIRYEILIDLAGTPFDFSDDEATFLGFTRESTGRTDDLCTAIVDEIG